MQKPDAEIGARRALLIANATYGEMSGFASLHCPVNDAEALRDVLSDPTRDPFDEVVLLVDKTRSEVMIALKEQLAAADRGDTMLIYFSGHGQPDEEGRLHFVARDTRRDHLEATGIAAVTVSDLIRRSAVSRKALILDCCYAGSFTSDWKSGDGVIEDRMQALARGSGTYVLMATGALSLAQEDPEHGLSILTRHIVEGLRGAADTDRSGWVTIRNLSRYVHREVTRHHAQEPTEAGLDVQGDMALTRSGVDTAAEEAAVIRSRLLEWLATETITPAIFAEASDVLAEMREGKTASATQPDILREVGSGRMGSGKFMSDWLDTRRDVSDGNSTTEEGGHEEKPRQSPATKRPRAELPKEEVSTSPSLQHQRTPMIAPRPPPPRVGLIGLLFGGPLTAGLVFRFALLSVGVNYALVFVFEERIIGSQIQTQDRIITALQVLYFGMPMIIRLYAGRHRNTGNIFGKVGVAILISISVGAIGLITAIIFSVLSW